ncbi:hypothetical protein [Prosthecodimorpha staleyi]|uniref:Bacteriophage-related protein n=1 Tax=Prosthecodimorpha staleyi TaxID=2840188 RepID=A0A947GES0_9HYPH|nr:hypothetical protein [Prosthecodimorpha staleyi]MBT9291816.1 hypothetical protein [Prosthecodimorpha staleyi]
MTAILDPSTNTITISIPIKMRKRGGRKLVLAPDGADWAPAGPKVDNVLVKAIARAFRWRKLLETGAYATIDELATAERINPSYVSRLLRLTLLAPEIVVSVLDGWQPAAMQLDDLLAPFPVEWEAQKLSFLHTKLASRVSPDL